MVFCFFGFFLMYFIWSMVWMCSVYNALGSEWLKWKQCKPTQLVKPCLIGKISCFFSIITLFISSEKELCFIHAKGDATKNLAVLCAKMASSLMCGNYPQLKLWSSGPLYSEKIIFFHALIWLTILLLRYGAYQNITWY